MLLSIKDYEVGIPDQMAKNVVASLVVTILASSQQESALEDYLQLLIMLQYDHQKS